MIDIFQLLEDIFGNFYFLLGIMSISCIAKWSIFYHIIKQKVRHNQTKISQIALLALLAGSAITDFSWIPKLLDSLDIISIDYSIILFFIRIAWAGSVLEYQGMSLFLESLSEKNYRLSKRQITFLIISGLLIISYLYFAFFYINCSSPDQRTLLELQLRDNVIPLYNFFLPIFSLIILIIRIKTKTFPHILRQQLILFMRVVSIPIIGDFLQVFPFASHSLDWVANSYATVTISAITLTWAMYYYSYKIAALRFLDLDDQVAQRLTNPLLEDFRSTLERLGAVTNAQELKHITGAFFKETFYIPIVKTHFYIRELNEEIQETKNELHSIQFLVETFISTHKNLFDTFIAQHRILMSQEIEFSNFYRESETSKKIAHFLNTINADIFVPIYHNGHCIGYIIVEKSARTNMLYTRFEQDQIILYTTYLGNIIHLLQTKSGQTELTKTTSTRNKLHQQKCELSFYKESIKTFYGKNDIGIITYKNRTFIFNNKEASLLLSIDPNVQPGHPVTKALIDIIKNAEQFHTAYVTQIYNQSGQQLQLCAVPDLEGKGIIITVSYPNIADIIKPHLDIVRNQTEWNYLLYLHTTEIGKFIQSFLPGNSQLALQFNIDLLKKAIQTHTCFVQGHENDTNKITRIIHAIHKRKTIYTLHITKTTNSNDIAIQLFGINPLFNTTSHQAPLMETLHEAGTLFISNIHLLSSELQNQLADYIENNKYRPLKSERTYESNVLIICTSTIPLAQLLEKGALKERLYIQLRKNSICTPELSLITPQELYPIIDAIAAQIIGPNTLFKVLQLTIKEKERLYKNLPKTIHQLKANIENIITKKIEKTIHKKKSEKTHPLIDHAATLGKRALKDKELMQELLSIVQNKKRVSEILGVNRSSIYRHYKEE